MKELGQALKNIPGVTDYRIKQKKGCRTYAFVDFVNYGEAHKGINMYFYFLFQIEEEMPVWGKNICLLQSGRTEGKQPHQ